MRDGTSPSLSFVFLGLSITSSWGNGHATTYRGLLRELSRRGHRVRFLERDTPWYRRHRDLPAPPGAPTALYGDLEELADRFATEVRDADLTVVGSYVPDGAAVGAWALETAGGVVAFYDLDTPVTERQVAAGTCAYLSAELIGRYDLYLSFAGGPILRRLSRAFGVPARALYCAADPEVHVPAPLPTSWSLGYVGTYSADRQGGLDRLLVAPARRRPTTRFAVAGPQYPPGLDWPANIDRIDHVAPGEHPAFYRRQALTLNLTRRAMRDAGWSPSVRLFEAAACGVPVLSDDWEGLDSFFTPGHEILIAHSGHDVLRYLDNLGAEQLASIGERARRRVLAEHTAAHRAAALERWTLELLDRRARDRRRPERPA